jgi:hypothetical protein
MYSKESNILERFLTTLKIHNFEDFIRYKMIRNYDLNIEEIIILSRILWGRIINSEQFGKILDSRHSKAQMVTVLCLFFYLYRQKNYTISNDFKELNKLLIYHLSKIQDYLVSYNTNNLKDLNQKYYFYCIKWTNYCGYIISNKCKNYDIFKKMNTLKLILNIPKINKININIELKIFISELNVDDFL